MNAADVLNGIRDANYHRGGLRCLRLLRAHPPFLARLRAEAEHLCAANAPSDVGRRDHVTNWTSPFGRVLQYSLLNATGRYDDFSTDHDLSSFGKRFHERARYPALATLVEPLEDAVNFRVNVLGPGGGLKPHEEHAVVRDRFGAVGVRARFHLPLVTSSGSEIVLDGDVYHLEAGSVFFVNHGCVHGARNAGPRARVHLVWDALLTADSFELMFGEDSLGGLPLDRVPPRERTPTPVRSEPVREVRRLPDLVPEAEARELVLLKRQ